MRKDNIKAHEDYETAIPLRHAKAKFLDLFDLDVPKYSRLREMIVDGVEVPGTKTIVRLGCTLTATAKLAISAKNYMEFQERIQAEFAKTLS